MPSNTSLQLLTSGSGAETDSVLNVEILANSATVNNESSRFLHSITIVSLLFHGFIYDIFQADNLAVT